jgi:hypothetical protein
MLKTSLFVAAAAFLASTAQAVLLQYTISGTDTLSSGQVEYASFRIDTDRPVDGYAEGIGFYYAAVPGTYTYGATTTTEPQDITFYLDAANGYNDPNSDPGGLFVGEGDLLGFAGPQLFEAPIENPTLLTGRFTLLDAFSGSPISLKVAAVPEPRSWVMLITGFGLVGIALRRRALYGRPQAQALTS